MNLWTQLLAWFWLLPLGLFAFFYGTEPTDKWYRRRFSKLWRQTPAGRTLMYQKISMFALILYLSNSYTFGDFPGRDVIRFFLVGILVAVSWRLFFVLRKAQRPNESRDKISTNESENTNG